MEIRKTLSEILKTKDYMAETAETSRQAVKASQKQLFNIALVEVRLPDTGDKPSSQAKRGRT